ncbi:uncharacterized protein [Rutidosis leptorrhynchoides]|uniref:uncharacterized protein n=1 Tax=Rutidosis leptorrhynchoides TaxID=125765 RepID=UPI003A98EB00
MRVIDFPKNSRLANVRFAPPNFDAGEKAKTKAFGNSMVTVPGVTPGVANMDTVGPASAAKRKGDHHVQVGPTKKKTTPSKDTVDKEVQLTKIECSLEGCQF